APTAIYPLSLHDALPICRQGHRHGAAHEVDGMDVPEMPRRGKRRPLELRTQLGADHSPDTAPEGSGEGRGEIGRKNASQICTHRSEEHTSELQSPCNLVC